MSRLLALITRIPLASLVILLSLPNIITSAQSLDEPLLPSQDVSSPSSSLLPLPPTTPTNPPKPTTTIAATTVISLFYLDISGPNGLHYTQLSRVGGSVISFDETATVFAVTPTFSPQRPLAATSTTIKASASDSSILPPQYTSGGNVSTITQGRSTFEITATDWQGQPECTLVNRCSLRGTTSAVCNQTWVGTAWYMGTVDGAGNPRAGLATWDGKYVTYSYSWTIGDRYGFAPVTITQGVEMLPAETDVAEEENAAPQDSKPLVTRCCILVSMAIVLVWIT